MKPENVLLQDGIPRLTDFGLARVLKTEAQTGTISGTPRYMAPETFSGSYSAASDLWAVGVMLYELLAGRTPFRGETPIDIMMKTVQNPVTPPSTVAKAAGRRAIDRTLENICMTNLYCRLLRDFLIPQSQKTFCLGLKLSFLMRVTV